MEEDDDFEIPSTSLYKATAPKTNICSRRNCESGSLPELPLRHSAKKPKTSFRSLGCGEKNAAFDLYNHFNSRRSVAVISPSRVKASITDSLTDQVRIGQTSDSDILDNDGLAPLELTQTKMLAPPKEKHASSVGENDGGGLLIIANEDEYETMESELDVLIQLCSDVKDITPSSNSIPTINCPLCGIDLSGWDNESKHLHSNTCLYSSGAGQAPKNSVNHDRTVQSDPDDSTELSLESCQFGGTAAVIQWLRSLGLDKYETNFIKHEIDWASLQWLNEEDLISMGIMALGPRKKILQSLDELRKGETDSVQVTRNYSKFTARKTKQQHTDQLITDFFSGPSILRSGKQERTAKDQLTSNQKQLFSRKVIPSRKLGDIPSWCQIPGTPFCVDAFRYLRRDCFHWFLTHFHVDHYQGLTKSFSYGTIYCSLITARLVNMKIGIAWDKLKVLPLDEKINIDGVQVTCFDANHCPGSLIILFEPPNGKAVLHTGDFRFSDDMESLAAAISCPIHTLILDTTYCDPKYDFPKQEAVVQFMVEAIQAESFNPRTLFFIGSYTIGKEKLFFEVARTLRRKVYVTDAKLQVLECLGLHQEDTQWLTTCESESHIHVVPIWTLANFKRLKQLSLKYSDQYSLIVAFSPTGWTFGKGKRKSAAGRRWQQGTIIRYEVPYSEHCSFTELKKFVQLLSPVNVIPSVNNDGEESSRMMLAHLYS